MAEKGDSRQWSGRTDGLPWMIRSLVFIMKVVDRRVIYCIMALVVPFYMLFGHKGYIAIYHFYRLRFGYGPVKSFFKVYRTHFTFGKVIVDRYAAYAGKEFRYNLVGNENYLALSQGESGFIQLSSHIGNFEMAGYGLTSTDKRMYGLYYGGESQVMIDFRRRILERHNIGLIPVDGTMSHLFEMNAVLDRGEIITMTGDRVFGSGKNVMVDFLGKETEFPLGPFAMAVQKGVPVLAIFVMKESAGDYTVYIEPVESDSSLKPRERMSAMAVRFASLLEDMVRKYPDQWFNFYDFWKDDTVS